MVVLALAAPVVASVMEPEVTTARDPEPPAASVDRATDDAASARPTRMTPAASPDRTLRQQRAEELAREEAELAREEARQEAREAAKREAARRARLRELAE